MPCKATRSPYGTTYIIPSAKPVKTPDGRQYHACGEVMAWWDRGGTDMSDENLCIRQENGTTKADLMILTLGQVYDLHHALGCAIMRS